MKRTLRYIWDHFEGFLITVLFAAMLVTVFVQIVSRIALNNPFMFTEELSRYIFLWMVFVGFSYVVKKGTSLSLVFIANRIKGKKQNAFQILINLFSVSAFVYIGYWSIRFIGFQWINRAPAMQFSMGIVYLIVPFSMLLCIVRSVELIVENVKALKSKLVGDSQAESKVA